MAEAIILDCNGPREMTQLLHTIHPDVIEAAICNTLAYRFINDPEFEKKTYPLDGLAGVYAVTFAVRNQGGRSLNKNEWKRLEGTIRKYIRCDERSENYSEDFHKANIEMIANIERMHVSKDATHAQLREDARAGRRQLWWETGSMFCRGVQALRIPQALDPDGSTRQIQSLTQVGCAIALMTRVSAHDQFSNMRSLAKPLILVLSCLKFLGLDVEVIHVLILKIWTNTQLKKAEILIT